MLASIVTQYVDFHKTVERKNINKIQIGCTNTGEKITQTILRDCNLNLIFQLYICLCIYHVYIIKRISFIMSEFQRRIHGKSTVFLGKLYVNPST